VEAHLLDGVGDIKLGGGEVLEGLRLLWTS
jgi:hypothetical protein